ncbi:MAG: alanine--tRNA ligase [Clostridiales bacterium]|jgi:alanyl-tRNA synthetase|nr:alanine--tRNA ligase [Clostridiales bacterium]
MKEINAKKLRAMWMDFFKGKGHTVISSASLIPENDPTVLFTTAGMHPLVPYLLGEKHPGGNRLANVQKCVRTGDIDEVGDASHCTFFEMLGNWSLGDYFKEEMIAWSYEFLTDPKYLGLDPKRLAVSVFEGDGDCPRDEVSAAAWARCGIKRDRIFYLPKANNWWGPAGQTGPCGSDSEMFIDTGKPACSEACSPACDCGKYLEIWNDVFMEFNKTADGAYEPLAQKNVDTGMGLERTLCTLEGKKSVYETDVFAPIIAAIEKNCPHRYGESDETTKAVRIVADHVRTAVFMLGDEKGVLPGNVGQGYILRRLIRRAVRFARQLELGSAGISAAARAVVGEYQEVYPELLDNGGKIAAELEAEMARFEKTLTNGIKEFEKLCQYLVGDTVSGKAAFRLYDTFGFPVEMTEELARERGLKVNTPDFYAAYAQHQKKSQAGAEGNFKGGMADNTEVITRLHTATHLLHRALKTVLQDENVNQKGSNITEERLRFDFTFGRPMTEAEIKAVEDLVNAQIRADLPVICEEMTAPDAKKQGAIGLFTQKYGERVKVYSIGSFSKEICGGPHAARTGELGAFTILKEQSSSAGVRRIKAVLR